MPGLFSADGQILAGQDRDDVPGDAVTFHRASIVG